VKTLKVSGIKRLPKSEELDKEKRVQLIINTVAKGFKLNPELLKKDTKERKVINARHIAMFLCKTILNLPYSQIGEFFGKKDHTAVMYAVKKVEQRCREDRKVYVYGLLF
jgi:chromosomal replication initiator protein